MCQRTNKKSKKTKVQQTKCKSERTKSQIRLILSSYKSTERRTKPNFRILLVNGSYCNRSKKKKVCFKRKRNQTLLEHVNICPFLISNGCTFVCSAVSSLFELVFWYTCGNLCYRQFDDQN